MGSEQDNFKFSSKLLDALNFANERHAGHLRKGTEIPYLTHLLAVSSLAIEDSSSDHELKDDIETIASIFSQGLFLIIADLLQMFLVIIVMLYVNFELSLIVFSILPIILYATKLFQKSMKKAFEDVRLQVANLNSFVQEIISGMKIVQIFNRENEEYNKFKLIKF